MICYFIWEGFETVILPRTVTHGWRFTRSFYRTLWRRIWQPLGHSLSSFRHTDTFLGYFGPISLLILIQVWVGALIVGYALVEWGLDTPLINAHDHPSFGTYLYLSGVTFFTLGYGDVTPQSGSGRFVAVLESSMGYGFLALIIGYLPVLYGAFSARESNVTLLDARAGSPPTALELLRRYSAGGAIEDLPEFLMVMERWISAMLESHLSYPVLCYYRSQHDDQSWLSALVVMMDVCSIILSGLEGISPWQAQLTFAMGRHALIDLSTIFGVPPAKQYLSRLTPPDMEKMRQVLSDSGLPFKDAERAAERLAELRRTYEPYAVTLARTMSFPLPAYVPAEATADDWQRSTWERDEHF